MSVVKNAYTLKIIDKINMRTVIICQGLPASGKSTWAKEQIKKEPSRWKRINRDDLRAMINDSHFDRKNEEFIRNVQEQLLRATLIEGYDVILDNTSLVPQTVKKLHKVCASIGDVKVIHKTFPVDIEECIRRNNLREGKAKVPEKVIRDMAKGAGLDHGRKLEGKEIYYPPHQFQIIEQDESLTRAVIFDNDGTISLLNGRNPYDASTCDQDLPHKHVIECMRLYHQAGYKIIFVSGRDEKDRAPTEKFYKQHFPEVKYELYMRPAESNEKDVIVKERIYNEEIKNKYYVAGWFDDRISICDFVFQSGLPLFRVNDPRATF